MRNIDFAIEDNELIIRVRLDVQPQLSRSKLSEVVATSGGNVIVPVQGSKPVKINLNVFYDVSDS